MARSEVLRISRSAICGSAAGQSCRRLEASRATPRTLRATRASRSASSTSCLPSALVPECAPSLPLDSLPALNGGCSRSASSCRYAIADQSTPASGIRAIPPTLLLLSPLPTALASVGDPTGERECAQVAAASCARCSSWEKTDERDELLVVECERACRRRLAGFEAVEGGRECEGVGLADPTVEAPALTVRAEENEDMVGDRTAPGVGVA